MAAESSLYKCSVIGNQNDGHNETIRATTLKVMKAVADPVGPENDNYLLALSKGAAVIVAAWGTNGTHMACDEAIRKVLPSLYCLALAKKGHPRHPLYLRKTQMPISMEIN